jgi:hypothetical protein
MLKDAGARATILGRRRWLQLLPRGRLFTRRLFHYLCPVISG